MLVDDRALAAEGLIEGDAVVREPQQPGQPPLAVLDRFAPDVFAVHLEQVERAEDRARVGAVAADEIEHGKSVVVANNGLAIDDTGSYEQNLNRFGSERKAVGAKFQRYAAVRRQ